MAELTNSYWFFTFIGIIVTFIQFQLNFFIFHKYTIKSKLYKKLEYQLILFRVALDTLNGFTSFIYFATSIPILLTDAVPFEVTFLIGLIGSNILEMRSFLAAVIAIERVLSTTVPMEFHKYRKRVSNLPIMGFVVLLGLFCDVYMFGICDFRLPLPSDCSNFACATSACYQRFASAVKIVYSLTNAVFSAVLCYKLFWLSWKQTEIPIDLRKANLLSLTDGLSTLTFDLFPSLLSNLHLVDFKGLGPAIGAFRQTGRAVEAAVMVKLMKRKNVLVTGNSASLRPNAP